MSGVPSGVRGEDGLRDEWEVSLGQLRGPLETNPGRDLNRQVRPSERTGYIYRDPEHVGHAPSTLLPLSAGLGRRSSTENWAASGRGGGTVTRSVR